jgi:UPF0755 protein
MSKRALLVTLTIASIILISAIAVTAKVKFLLSPVEPGRQVAFTVASGATVKDIAKILYDVGLIRSQELFRYAVRQRQLDGKLKAGDYSLASGLTIQEIVDRLERGQVNTVTFTVPEGLNVLQIADLLSEKGLVDKTKFLLAARNKDLVKDLLPDDPAIREPLEGYMFPNTYKVRRGSAEEEFVKVMVDAEKAFLTREMEDRLAAMHLTFHQALTLASIIEREAVFDEERALISAVYNNRLRIKMKLDADPTVLYAWGRTAGLLTYKDLELDSPYNTYRVPGLPPGPISTSGARALWAAVNPAQVDYLYFVASPDKTHVFSRTLSEHTANVRKIQSAPR